MLREFNLASKWIRDLPITGFVPESLRDVGR